MINQKITILFILVSFIFSSCEDNRDEFIREMKSRKNTEPTLVLTSVPTGVFKDSMKLSQDSYLFKMSIGDPQQNQTSLEFEAFPKGGWTYIKVSDNNQKLLGSKVDFGGRPLTNLSLAFSPESTGRHKIDLSVLDEFGKNSSLVFDLEVFHNLPPVASFSVDPGINSPYEVILTNSSFDGDEKYGGKIITGTWEIEGVQKAFEADQELKWIFPMPGTYLVKLTVKDNDEEAVTIEKNITVPIR